MTHTSATAFSEHRTPDENAKELNLTGQMLKSINAIFGNLAEDFELELEQDFFISVLHLSATFLACISYMFFFEPISCFLFESRPMRYKVQGYFMQAIESLVELVYSRSFKYEITGDQYINPKSLAAVFSNHQGFIDYLTILNLSGKCGLDNSYFFFVWKHCVRFPSLQVLYNAWRKRSNWRVPSMVLSDVFCPVLESPWRDQGGKWIVIFPEVTPWSTTLMLEHRTECSKNGCPKLENLLYPRFNAFNQTVTFLRDYPLADVYDLTITYINVKNGNKVGVPTWKNILLSRRDWVINISIKKTNASQLPYKEKHLIKWLEKQWYHKDESITELKKNLSENAPKEPVQKPISDVAEKNNNIKSPDKVKNKPKKA